MIRYHLIVMEKAMEKHPILFKASAILSYLFLFSDCFGQPDFGATIRSSRLARENLI